MKIQLTKITNQIFESIALIRKEYLLRNHVRFKNQLTQKQPKILISRIHKSQCYYNTFAQQQIEKYFYRNSMKQQSKVKIITHVQSEVVGLNKQSIKVENIQMNGLQKKPYSSEHKSQQLQTEASILMDDQKSQSQVKMTRFLQHCQAQDQQNIFQSYLKQVTENQRIRQENFKYVASSQQYCEKYKQERQKRAKLERINQELRNQLMTIKSKIEQQKQQQHQNQKLEISKLAGQLAILHLKLQKQKQKYETYKSQTTKKIAQNRKTIDDKVKQLTTAKQTIFLLEKQINEVLGLFEERVKQYNEKVQRLQQSLQQMQKNKAVEIQSDQQALRIGLYQNSMPIEIKQQHLLEKQKKLKKFADQLYLLAQKVQNANNVVL